MITHSIKWRLQAWHGFLLVCLVTGLMAGFYTFERRTSLQAIDNELAESITPLLPRLSPPGGRGPGERSPADRGRRPPPLEEDGPPPPEYRRFEEGPPDNRGRELRRFNSDRVYYVSWSPQGDRLSASTNAPAELPRPRLGPAKAGRELRTREGFRELTHLIPNGASILVGTSLAPTLAGLQKLAAFLVVIGCGIVALGLAVGWWLATRSLRPIAEITHAAQAIAAGDLSQRINPSEAESELGQLATVLNGTFARLDAAFAQQQRFTSDAAHELRTPVAVILTQTQSTLNRERSSAEYRETLEACQRAAQRMRRLIESLLELARLDAGPEVLKRSRFDLAQTAADCVELVRPLAEQRNIQIVTELSSTETEGDAERLAQVITNLLSNAVNHNREDGEIHVTTNRGGGAAWLTVADNGPGIAPEHLPHIFDRFYRADAARTSAHGRSGLGLAISKAIVEAHGGSLAVVSEPGAGATFTVRLPVA